MQYKVITQSTGIEDFNFRVSQWLAADWEPLGSCVIIPPAGTLSTWTYFQTLIKKGTV